MEQLDTVSKIVDEATIIRQEQSIGNSLKSTAPTHQSYSKNHNKTANRSHELTLAVIYEHETACESQTLETPTHGTNPGGTFRLSDEDEDTESRRICSETPHTNSIFKKAYQFDNPVFNGKYKTSRHGRKSFADIVTDVIPETTKADIHPFGRRSMFGVPLGGEQTHIHREEGTLFIWVLATIIILGVAVGVIVMSQMYQANNRNNGTLDKSSKDWNVTEN